MNKDTDGGAAAKLKAPVDVTGGGGFRFEDAIAARFLLDMLTGLFSLGVRFGRLQKLHWQVRESGWLADDLVGEFIADGAARHASFSIKHDRQVTEGGFPEAFVEAARNQMTGQNGARKLAPHADAVVLVVGKLANSVREAWDKLLGEALAADDARVLARLQPPNGEGSQSSRVARALHQSFAPTTSDAPGALDVIRHVRLLDFDFGSETSRDEGHAVCDAQGVLTAGDVEQARLLWSRLYELASTMRSRGGTLDAEQLARELKSQFALSDHPDFRADWSALQTASAEAMDDVRMEIAGLPRLAHPNESDRLAAVLEEHQVCALVGESGVGKSALAREFAEDCYARVVWLTADAAASVIGSLGHSLADVLASSRERVVLVIDAAERFATPEFKKVAHAVRTIRTRGAGMMVHVLVTMQSESAARIADAFAEHSTSLPNQVTLERPSEDAARELLSNVPAMRWTSFRADVRPALRNLKVLEWVVRGINAGQAPDSGKILNVSALIDFLWARWIEGSSSDLDAAEALKQIARIEGDSLSGGVPRSALGSSSSAVLRELERRDLVRLRHERVFFTHDLVGDWARLRVLLEHGAEVGGALRDCAAKPRWHRAIRLLGQNLIDRGGDGLEQWAALVRTADDEKHEDVIVRDLLLEASFLASDAAGRLESVWNLLVAEQARLLSILLQRFQYAATATDPEMRERLGPSVPHADFQHLFRVPQPVYWGGVLEALDRHREDVARFTDAARIAKMWLAWVPRSTSTRRILWRNEAANVAIAIAREIQGQIEEGASSRECKEVFEAVLHAAPDRPQEVVALCLELAARRPLGQAAVDRRRKANERTEESRRRWERDHPDRAAQARTLSRRVFSTGQLRAPWPHGPSGRVPEAFATACFEAAAFSALVSVDPVAACEVLLAVCIEEPQEEDPHGYYARDDDRGMTHWSAGYPAMYFRGPFLRLLRECPTEGLSFAIRLVNFATERWLDESKSRRSRMFGEAGAATPQVEIVVDGETHRWVGDDTVYQWHYTSPLGSGAVSCALMALEKWLYEQIDEGKDVSSCLRTILKESRSLAFAGVLVDIGKRTPALFAGELQELLAVWELYAVDSQVVAGRSGSTWPELIGWGRQPQQLVSLAADWYGLSHRKQLLWNVATYLLLSNASIRPFFERVRTEWSALVRDEQPETLVLLIERLNLANYSIREREDGSHEIALQWPARITERHAAETRQMEKGMVTMNTPWRCRRWLDGEAELSDSDVSEILRLARDLDPDVDLDQAADDLDVRDPRDALFGVIAVLTVLRPATIAADSALESWCRSWLERAVDAPRAARHWGDPPLGLERGFDAFVAEAGVALIARNSDDELGRRLAAGGGASARANVVSHTMRRAYLLRGSLKEDFQRLQVLVARCCAVASAEHQFHPGSRQSSAAAERRVAHADAFTRRALPSVRPSLAEMRIDAERELAALAVLGPDSDGHPTSETVDGRRQQPHARLDDRLLLAAFGWIDVRTARAGEEQESWMGFLREALSILLTDLREKEDDDRRHRRSSLPGDFDRWVLARTVDALSALDADGAQTFWQPVVELGSDEHDYVETFLDFCLADARRRPAGARAFSGLWRAMIECAVTHPGWQPRGARDGDVARMVCALYGFHAHSESNGDPASEPYVTAIPGMLDLFASAAARWFSLPLVAARFAAFASTDDGAPFRLPGLVWLSEPVASYEDEAWEDAWLSDAIVRFLRTVWERERMSVAAPGQPRSSFERLLTVVAARGGAAAQALRDNVVDSLAVVPA